MAVLAFGPGGFVTLHQVITFALVGQLMAGLSATGAGLSKEAVSENLRERPKLTLMLYNTVDIAQTLYLLDRYHVSYIYVGDLERAFYDPNGIAKFHAMAYAGQLELVYENDQVKIYKVGTLNPPIITDLSRYFVHAAD